MAALTGRKPSNTYIDLLQVSNSNSGIDGTLRSVSDGGGTSSPFQLSSTAGAWASGTFTWNGTVDLSAATVTFANDQIAMVKIDWSGTDTLDGTYNVTGTMDASAATFTLPDNNVTFAKLADGTQGGIIYYGASGAPAELAAGTDGLPLVTNGAGADPTYEELSSTGIADEAVTNAKLSHVSSSRIKGRVTPSTGDVEDLTAAQVVTLLQSSGLLATARAKVTNAGSAALAESVGITSVNRTGTGVVVVVLASTMSSSNYTVAASLTDSAGHISVLTKSSTGFTINTRSTGTSSPLFDSDFDFVVIGTPA